MIHIKIELKKQKKIIIYTLYEPIFLILRNLSDNLILIYLQFFQLMIF